MNKRFSFVKIMTGFMFALVIFPSNIKAIVIILFTLSILFLINKRKWSFNKELFLTNAVLYFVILITLFYSNNLPYALNKLQTMSAILVFPLVFSMINEKEVKELYKHKKVYLSIYIVGVFLLNTIPFFWYFITHYSFIEIITHYPRIIMVDIGKYGIHPIYMSLHCSMAIIFSLIIFKDNTQKVARLTLIVLNLILILFLLIYARKGPILALFITVFIWAIFQNKTKYYISITTALILGAILIISIPRTKERFAELLNIGNTITSVEKETSISMRVTIYKSVKDLVIQSPLLGYGIGDYNDKLRVKNKEEGYINLSKKSYNAHNQYLSFLLIGGALCLLPFLFMISKNIIMAIHTNNHVLVLIIILFSVVMLTENILERENGVIFFSLFLNFFALKNYYNID